MRRCGDNEYNIVAWHNTPETMDNGDAIQRPARYRLVDMPRNLGFGHFGIMLERQRNKVVPTPADAGETDDGADIGACLGQSRDLAADVEIGFLDADGHDGGHEIIAIG